MCQLNWNCAEPEGYVHSTIRLIVHKETKPNQFRDFIYQMMSNVYLLLMGDDTLFPGIVQGLPSLYLAITGEDDWCDVWRVVDNCGSFKSRASSNLRSEKHKGWLGPAISMVAPNCFISNLNSDNKSYHME